MATIYITGYLDIPPSRVDVVQQALPQQITDTIAEPHCLNYSVTNDKDIENRLLVNAKFANSDALSSHFDRTRDSHWGQVTAGIPRFYEISEEL